MVKQSDIQNYGMDVRDLDTSALEMIDMLDDEKNEVTRYDLILISNAQAFYEKLKTIYAFQHSKQADDEWWWHLQKIVQAFDQNIELGKRPVIPNGDGILAIPIPAELRTVSDLEMKDFIRRHKEMERDIPNQ
jgi:hypothetical protein